MSTPTAEAPRSALWESYPDTMTKVDYQFSHKNFLTEIFPRLIAGWGLFSKEDQDRLVAHERVRWEAWKIEYPDWVDLN